MVVVGGLLTGCGSAAGDPVADGRCEPAEAPEVQGGGHLLAGVAPPVPYSSDPATSGWHAGGGGPAPGARTEPLDDPTQVSVLERGGVVLVHDPDLPAERATALRALADEVDGDVVAAPHARSLSTPVALTAWGVLQRCTDLDAATLAGFVDAHGGGGAPH